MCWDDELGKQRTFSSSRFCQRINVKLYRMLPSLCWSETISRYISKISIIWKLGLKTSTSVLPSIFIYGKRIFQNKWIEFGFGMVSILNSFHLPLNRFFSPQLLVLAGQLQLHPKVNRDVMLTACSKTCNTILQLMSDSSIHQTCHLHSLISW